jgi:hypothetical protein
MPKEPLTWCDYLRSDIFLIDTDNSSGPQTIVTVNIGAFCDEKPETFRIHENYLTHYSPYFNSAFRGSFSESESKTLDLDDTHPTVFGIFVNWLYTRKIIDARGTRPSFAVLLNVWILADRILVPSLKNQVMDIPRTLIKFFPSLGSAEYHRVYEKTLPESPMRAFLADTWERRLDGDLAHSERFPHELLVDVAKAAPHVFRRDDRASMLTAQ